MSQDLNTKLIKTTAIGVFILGLIVLSGWFLQIPLLTTLVPGYTSMKANTAFLFVVSGIELYRQAAGKWPWLNYILCIGIATIGALIFIQYLLGINMGLDELLFRDFMYKNDSSFYPGRVSQGASLSFMLIGVALCLIKSSSYRLRVFAQYLLHIITLIAAIAIFGHLLDVPLFYKISSVGSTAIHTAITFFVFSIAASLFNKDLGITGLLSSNKVGSMMARQLFPTLTVSVIILGIIMVSVHKQQLISVEFGIGLFATSFLLVGLALIALSAKQLNRINFKKTLAEEQLMELNKNLEKIVEQRTNELHENMEALKNSKDEVWKKEQLLTAVINNAASAIFVKNQEGKYILANKKFATDFETDTDSIVGKTAFDLFPEEVAAKLIENEAEIIQSGKGVNGEVSVEIKGIRKTMLTNKFPLFDTNNNIFAICCIATDFTDLKNSKTEQEILSIQLQRKNQQLLNFAHITSHNLRSPVSNLNSLLWLYKESQTSEEKALLFEKFETVIHNLSDTLNELVDALKIQEDTDKKREPLQFEDVFKKVKESMAGKIMETEAVVSYNFTKAPNIEYPRIYLESILQNLLSNSLKYRSPSRTPVIHAETSIENGILKLSFKDNGLGIDLSRHQGKLFGLNKTFHRHQEAKGVGLFITKTQVEAMGGSIVAESEVDKGSNFIIYFNKKQ